MKNKGFTLLELLVVGLIVSILAGIALPQYKRTIEKSKAAQALSIIRSIASAQQDYYLANGVYATKFDNLSIEIPWTGNTKIYTGNESTDTRSNEDWSMQIYSYTNQYSLFIGRIKGPYKGASFEWRSFSSADPSTTNHIMCHEQLAGGIIFTKKAGDYCEKIMQGKLENSFFYGRQYSLP